MWRRLSPGCEREVAYAVAMTRHGHGARFGIGLETGVGQVSEMLRHARVADEAGLDVVSLSDHPYFAERIDAYAALPFVLGATTNIAAAAVMTNLLSRPAPILARTATGLSAVSGGRFVLGIGAGGLWDEIVALGVPRLSPAARVRALEEAIMVVRALSGGGDPVTFEGEFYQVTELTPRPYSRRRSGSALSARRRWQFAAVTQTDGYPAILPIGEVQWLLSRDQLSTRPRRRSAGTRAMWTRSTT